MFNDSSVKCCHVLPDLDLFVEWERIMLLFQSGQRDVLIGHSMTSAYKMRSRSVMISSFGGMLMIC